MASLLFIVRVSWQMRSTSGLCDQYAVQTSQILPVASGTSTSGLHLSDLFVVELQ